MENGTQTIENGAVVSQMDLGGGEIVVATGGQPAPTMDTRAMAPVRRTQSDVAWALVEKALDTNVDLDRLERLMGMHEKIQAKEEKRQFRAAMAAARGNVGKIVKDMENQHTKSSYASMDAINDAIKAPMADEGLSVSVIQLPDESNDNFIMAQMTISHSGGHEEVSKMRGAVDSGGMRGNSNKSAIQAMGSTLSYLQRYMTNLSFNLSSSKYDNDGNNQNHEAETDTISQDQVNEIRGLIDQSGTRLQAILGAYNIATLSQMKEPTFDAAKERLLGRIAAQAQDQTKN